MASALVKKPCAKCNKGGGVTTCDGCQQSFCIKHIVEHRQELAIQLDNAGQEHDLFRRDLTQETVTHPLFADIDEWEHESITKIQVAAETARADLRQLLNQNKDELRVSTDRMTNEMQTSQELDDYTETDLIRWAEQLKQLRRLLETQFPIQVVENADILTSIHMIKIREQQPLHASSRPQEANSAGNDLPCRKPPAVNHERFRSFIGRVILSEDGLLATCLATYWDGSNVFGNCQYSSGVHEIHFQIEDKGSNNIFFGIKTATYDMPVQTLNSPHIYGWWEIGQSIESVGGQRVHHERMIRVGDEVTMILDCDNRQIHFNHYRIKTTSHLPVDLEKCPFPWKIVLTLRSSGDSVRILQ